MYFLYFVFIKGFDGVYQVQNKLILVPPSAISLDDKGITDFSAKPVGCHRFSDFANLTPLFVHFKVRQFVEYHFINVYRQLLPGTDFDHCVCRNHESVAGKIILKKWNAEGKIGKDYIGEKNTKIEKT